jgi:hypothetical protein
VVNFERKYAMEISQNVLFLESFGNYHHQEVKPQKGIEFDSEVQRFEQILFSKENIRLSEINSLCSPTVENALNILGDTVLGKIEAFKISIDNNMNHVNEVLNSEGELNIKDALKMQMQVGMYAVETTLVATTGNKVSDGITILFRNQ